MFQHQDRLTTTQSEQEITAMATNDSTTADMQLLIPGYIKNRNRKLASLGFKPLATAVEYRSFCVFRFAGSRDLFVSSGIVPSDFKFPKGKVPCTQGVSRDVRLLHGGGNVHAGIQKVTEELYCLRIPEELPTQIDNDKGLEICEYRREYGWGLNGKLYYGSRANLLKAGVIKDDEFYDWHSTYDHSHERLTWGVRKEGRGYLVYCGFEQDEEMEERPQKMSPISVEAILRVGPSDNWREIMWWLDMRERAKQRIRPDRIPAPVLPILDRLDACERLLVLARADIYAKIGGSKDSPNNSKDLEESSKLTRAAMDMRQAGGSLLSTADELLSLTQ